jgi:hypothetical protein
LTAVFFDVAFLAVVFFVAVFLAVFFFAAGIIIEILNVSKVLFQSAG